MLFPIRRAWFNRWHGSVMPAGGGGAATENTPPQSSESGEGASPPAAGVLDELSALLAAGRAVVSNFLELVSLEARRAGLTLVWMVACGIVGAVCLVAAWLGLMAALALWAISRGVPVIPAVIAVAVINCLAGAALIYRCVGMSRDLLFSGTRRQLAGSRPVTPPAP